MGDVMNGEELNGVVASVRKLSHSDLPALLSLCLGNPQYYAFLDEEPTLDALAAEMVELPPGCSPDQKSYLGFFDAGGNLIAVLGLVRGYPAEGCAFIGFFMVDASRQGTGVGSLLISQLLNRLRCRGRFSCAPRLRRGERAVPPLLGEVRLRRGGCTNRPR